MKKLKRLLVCNAETRYSRTHKLFGFAAASAAVVACDASANAQVILSDNFSNAGHTYAGALIGTSPDGTNLGGGVWGYTGRNDYDNRFASGSTYFANHPNVAFARNGTAAGISVQSSGSYTAPTSMTISAQLAPLGPVQVGTNNNNNLTATEVLGFYYTTQSSHYSASMDSTMVGLSLNAAGVLNYDILGRQVSTGITAPTAFDTDGFATLKFTESFDSSSGYATISNISLGGTSYSNVYTTGSLPNNPLAYAGFGGNANGFPTGSSIAALLVTGPGSGATAVPEPSSYALMVAGAAVLGALQLRRRRTI